MTKTRGRPPIAQVRRRQILDAAVEVISERGLSETRVSDIASRAGTSPASVLYYFRSKNRVLLEALTFAEDRFYAQVLRDLQRFESAREQLLRLIELTSLPGDATQAEWFGEWALWLEVWARSLRDPEVAKSREALDRRWRATITDIVLAGIRRGEFPAIDAEDFGLRLAALIDGLAIQVVLQDPAVTPARMCDICLRTVAGELGFEPPQARSDGLSLSSGAGPGRAKPGRGQRKTAEATPSADRERREAIST